MENYLPVAESERMNEYARLAVERHYLLRTTPEDVEEDGGTEAQWLIEDKMAGEWQRLDDGQRQAVSGLASDLAWVRRKGELAPKSHALADVTLPHAKLLIRALNEELVYEALHYVRVCRPLIGRHLSAVLRVSLYRGAFGGAAKGIFDGIASELFPRIGNHHELPSPSGWRARFGDMHYWPKRFPPHYWMEMWEEMLHHPERRFPISGEAKSQPLLGNRLACLMFETLPWPMSMSYLYAAVSTAPDGEVAAK